MCCCDPQKRTPWCDNCHTVRPDLVPKKEGKQIKIMESKTVMIGKNLEELTPDWQQIYLNGGPPCFAVMGDNHRFCNRAERWEGHPSDHKFVSWIDFLYEVMMWGQNAHASHTAAIREKALMTERSTVIEEAIKTISLWANDRGIAEQIADFAIAYHAKQNASGTVRLCFKCAGEESLVLEGVCANGER